MAIKVEESDHPRTRRDKDLVDKDLDEKMDGVEKPEAKENVTDEVMHESKLHLDSIDTIIVGEITTTVLQS